MIITEVKIKGKWIPYAAVKDTDKFEDMKCLANPDEIAELSHISIIKSIKLDKTKVKR
jgi:hypothetical protein